MVQLFLATVALGVVFAATPGAVNAEALRRGLARGFRPSLLVQLGAMVGDMLWAAIALMGTAFIARSGATQVLLGVAGGCFLLRLAWGALGEAWRGAAPGPARTTTRGDFVTGAFFSLANPSALAFWLGVGGSTVALTGDLPRASGALLFLSGFFLGALVWCLGSAAVIARGRRWLRPAHFRAITALCGTALGYFGLRLLWRAARLARVLRYLRFVGAAWV